MTFAIVLALSASHFLNDLVQSLVPALYPMLKEGLRLDFGQVGLIQMTFQLTASLLQPFVGFATDRHPAPYTLPIGMAASLGGLVLLAFAPTYGLVLIAAAAIGTGSSVFHPEATRVARLASGGRHGLAQSLFQFGGNSGQAVGPLLAALIIVPYGQASVMWFGIATLAAIVLLTMVGRWYAAHLAVRRASKSAQKTSIEPLRRGRVAFAIFILLMLIFSKYFYGSSIGSYYTFYLIEHFGLTIQQSQLYLFVFLVANGLGVLVGGPLGDRYGRKLVLWLSIFGAVPFTLVLPYVNLFWTVVLTIPIGIIMASAFPAIMVYAQELMPGRVGVVAGLFFGFAFGMGGLGAAVLGEIADHTSITFIYRLCAFLPLIGVLVALLPDVDKMRVHAA